MARILIRDLAEGIDLDREAMSAIAGGARVPQGYFERSTIGDSRIFSYPAGIGPQTAQHAPRMVVEGRAAEVVK